MLPAFGLSAEILSFSLRYIAVTAGCGSPPQASLSLFIPGCPIVREAPLKPHAIESRLDLWLVASNMLNYLVGPRESNPWPPECHAACHGWHPATANGSDT